MVVKDMLTEEDAKTKSTESVLVTTLLRAESTNTVQDSQGA